jgi:DNA helicase-2/ATP-dependent DNA helicase PcrA
MPIAHEGDGAMPKRYSFTADYATYLTCARQYMLFRKYDFAPSRTPYQMFGSLIHRTIDEIHNRVIALRAGE